MIELNKIEIIANTCQFKKPYNVQYQSSYPAPPPSTVLGILKVLYGEEIDNFIFGYTFKYEGKYKEIFNLYKIHKEKDENKKKRKKKNENIVMEPCIRELYQDPLLTIYTDLTGKYKLNYCLTMGRCSVGSLANVKRPRKIILKDVKGVAYNQFAPLSIGNGIIYNISVENKYNPIIDMFDIIHKKLRFNKKVEINKYYDEDNEENIVLFQKKGDELICLL